jgi:hypothetical protein
VKLRKGEEGFEGNGVLKRSKELQGVQNDLIRT